MDYYQIFFLFSLSLFVFWAFKKLQNKNPTRDIQCAEATYRSLAKNLRAEILEDFENYIVRNIKADCKLEGVERGDFITRFDNFLQDARIKQWNQASAELEQLKSDLYTIENKGRTLSTKLEELKATERGIWMGVASGLLNTALDTICPGLGVASSIASGVATTATTTSSAVAGDDGTRVTAVDEAVGDAALDYLPDIVDVGLDFIPFIGPITKPIGRWVKHNNKKLEFQQACENDPLLGRLYHKYKG